MNKQVRVILNSARILIGVQDANKLHDEVMRKLLHDCVTYYDNFRMNKKEVDDRFLHETPCGVQYDADNQDYIVYFGEGTDDEVREFVPEYLYYTNPDDINHRQTRIYLSTLGDYTIDSWQKFGVVGAFHGNNFEKYRLGMRLKLNITPELAAKYTWRLTFRKPFDQVLGYNDIVPFPAAHTDMLETALAFRSLDIVDDPSPMWDKKYARLKQSLMMTLKSQEDAYASWLKSEPESRTRNLIGYDWRVNPRNGRRGRYVPHLGGNE